MVYFCETCMQALQGISKLPIFPTHIITSQNLMTSSDSKGAFIHMWQKSYISKISVILLLLLLLLYVKQTKKTRAISYM